MKSALNGPGRTTVAGWMMIASCAMGLVTCGACMEAGEKHPFVTNWSERPNILVIVGDDVGKDVFSWHPEVGVQKAVTPVLDSLVRVGMVFTNVWNDPVCSASRAAMLTGRYGFRTGVRTIVPPDGTTGGLPRSETIIQQVLDTLSRDCYENAVIGKWHLADEANGGAMNPGLMGVQHHAGIVAGGLTDLFKWVKTVNGEQSDCENYVTSEFTDDAIAWLRHRHQPWLLWLAEYAAHTPHTIPPMELLSEETQERMKKRPKDLDKCLASIEAMDHEIGRLLAALDEGTRKRTVVVFIGDNGSAADVAQAPYSSDRAKSSLFAGGIEVPMVVAGPGVRHGRSSAFINGADLFATIAELAGLDMPRYQDSYSFAPLLHDSTGSNERDFLYSELQRTEYDFFKQNGKAIRVGPFKYMEMTDGVRHLYDLENDPAERTDLLEEAPPDSLKAIADQLRLRMSDLVNSPSSAKD